MEMTMKRTPQQYVPVGSVCQIGHRRKCGHSLISL